MKKLKLLIFILGICLLSLLLLGCKGTEVTIGENGNWFLDGVDSGVSAKGEKGADAVAPQLRINSTTNEWEISTDGGETWTSTGVKATGGTASGGTTSGGTTSGGSTSGGTTSGGSTAGGSSSGGTTSGEAASTDNPHGFEFLSITANTYGIKAGDALYLEEIVIPSTYQGKAVTQILPDGFASATNLKKLTLPASIEKIGTGAFSGCSALESVYISNLDAWLGIEFENGLANPLYNTADLYLNNSKLTALTLPATLTSLGNWAFYGCTSLQSVTFAQGAQLSEIGNSAFAKCTALRSISFPSSLTTIGNSAFGSCTALQAITIPANVTSLGMDAFYNCTAVTTLHFLATALSTPDDACPPFSNLGLNTTGVTVHIGAGVTKIPDYLFKADTTVLRSNKITNVIFADNSLCTEIGFEAFKRCTALTTVDFGTNSRLATIGAYAFHGCAALGSIALPATVTLIEMYAFANCSELDTVSFAAGSQLETIEKAAFYYCEGLTSIALPGTALTEIGETAFSYCKLLTSITIPATVTTIGKSAFAYCNTLSSAVFGAKTGWSVSSSYGSPLSIPSTDLSDTATAATYLREDYDYYTWTRTAS